MKIFIRKPTSMPGETTSVTMYNVNPTVGDIRLALGRAGKALDWRVSQENQKKLAHTRKTLEKHNIKIPGFQSH